MPKQVGASLKEKELPSIRAAKGEPRPDGREEKLLEEAEARLEIEEHLKPYIEKVEEEPQIPDDLSGHLHSHSQAATQVLQTGPTIQLPLTQAEIEKGLHHKVWDSILWLATWCIKIAKEAHRLGYKVIFGRSKRGEPS